MTVTATNGLFSVDRLPADRCFRFRRARPWRRPCCVALAAYSGVVTPAAVPSADPVGQAAAVPRRPVAVPATVKG